MQGAELQYQRMSYLFQAAHGYSVSSPSLSRFYVSLLRDLGMKHVLRLDSSTKKTFCKGCSSVFLLGHNCDTVSMPGHQLGKRTRRGRRGQSRRQAREKDRDTQTQEHSSPVHSGDQSDPFACPEDGRGAAVKCRCCGRVTILPSLSIASGADTNDTLFQISKEADGEERPDGYTETS
uniref:Uncharacterized protein n=1 Tax=Chromera velia CCMP2878 TaxID=1169474 RepID=A0A0G4GQ52_9ALVE|eukprot:Cvel_5043.t1-p1 / transcript=Cvel_5043.t1 / gene=Cvel_5043 / organism=Chromera_velia_CCMP2878 / gene_product=Ribonuclease P protein subunit rpr2, putative / transcript_product=Ribonuclease P protein subunit rpr2, putative / location=Cvel_scaffold229:109369-109899(-) / protein_length=177 / sequence_SO=supercontig / SO=protein_coding / is_pseudo=false